MQWKVLLHTVLSGEQLVMMLSMSGNHAYIYISTIVYDKTYIEYEW